MSCCCDQQQGLGEPWATSDYVVAGSIIAWGGHILLSGSNTAAGWGDDVEGPIKQALWNHGGFSMVDVGRESGIFNPYVSIKVTTRVDFAHLEDIFRTIEGAVYQAGFRPEAQAFWIESVPAAARGNSAVAQPGTGGSMNPGAQSGGGWNLPSISLPDIFGGASTGNSDGNVIDAIARWLNVTPTQAALIGAGVAIGGIVLLKRLL